MRTALFFLALLLVGCSDLGSSPAEWQLVPSPAFYRSTKLSTLNAVADVPLPAAAMIRAAGMEIESDEIIETEYGTLMRFSLDPEFLASLDLSGIQLYVRY